MYNVVITGREQSDQLRVEELGSWIDLNSLFNLTLACFPTGPASDRNSLQIEFSLHGLVVESFEIPILIEFHYCYNQVR